MLSALWETIHLDPPLFLRMEYLLDQNTSFIKKLRGDFWWVFFKSRKTDFFRENTDFSIPVHDTGSKVRKFEIRIRSEKLHIVNKNHLDSP